MKDLFQALLPYISKHKLRYVVIALFLILMTIFWMVPPQIIRLFVDGIISRTLTKNDQILYAMYFLGSIILVYIADFIWSYLIFLGSEDLGMELKNNLMKQYLSRNGNFYSLFKKGDLFTRTSEDVGVMQMTIGYGLMTAFNASIMIIFVVGMMIFTISPLLTIVSLLPLPFVSYFTYKWGTLVDQYYTKAQQAISQMNSELLELIDGVRVVRAFNMEKSTNQSFNLKTTETVVKNNQIAEMSARFEPLFELGMRLSYVISFICGVLLIQQGKITVGMLVGFQVYITMLIWPMIMLGDLISVAQQGKSAWRRIDEVLEQKETNLYNGNRQLKHFDSIAFKDFSFQYPNSESTALKHINFEIKKGQTIGIVGRTGSGKTTLIQQLFYTYPYTNQAPFINDIPLNDYRRSNVRQLFTFVPQEHTLFSGTIRDNLVFGDESYSDEDLYKVLEWADFKKDVLAFNRGLDTLVGEKGMSLSGGQKQRLALARAFLRSSSVLILDDALSAVDATTERQIMQYLNQHFDEQTKIIVTHRLSALEQADWILVLDDGCIVEQGNHNDLMNINGWYNEQYIHQQTKEV
ncbi:ABC transporter ATP-binding protein [Atopobacter phocae]|uniref:ABC transporter ATP-binding protein n=1 Tax=Atopobacter phocae TaxID=136492 RepID=UPI00046FC365|nr:ABC transporter ATP-binding protein [Atopobacter phocae]